MSFAKLKKQSRTGSLTDKLIKQVEKLNDKKAVMSMNVFGNHQSISLVMVMLSYDSSESEGSGYLGQEYTLMHFKELGGWYIENSLTTLGQKILSLSTTHSYGTLVQMRTKK